MRKMGAASVVRSKKMGGQGKGPVSWGLGIAQAGAVGWRMAKGLMG